MGLRVKQGARAFATTGVALLTALGAGAVQAQGTMKSAVFDVSVLHIEPGVQVTSSSKVWITASQARRDVKDGLSGDKATTVISKGFIYQLLPASKKGVKAPLPPELKASSNFEALLKVLTFDTADAIKQSKKTGVEKIAGYDCDVYLGSANKSQTKGDATEEISRTVKIWLPQKLSPKIPLKVEKTDRQKITKKDGSSNIDQSSTDTITVSNLQVNAPIAPSIFEIPKGFTIKPVSQMPQPQGPGGRGSRRK